jgi:hypothetical protein
MLKKLSDISEINVYEGKQHFFEIWAFHFVQAAMSMEVYRPAFSVF